MNAFISNTGINKSVYFLLFLIPLFINCRKVDVFDLSLAVNADTVHFDTNAGETHIMIYSNGNWEVEFEDEKDWVSINKTTGSGNSDIVFSYSKNFGASRSAVLVLRKGGEKKSITLIQEGIESNLRFERTAFTIPKQSLKSVLPISSEMKEGFKSVLVEYLYDDETMEKWITEDTLSRDGFTFTSLENESGRSRSVRIYLTVFNADGEEFTAFTDVVQSMDPAFLKQKYKTQSNMPRSAKIDTVILSGNVSAQFSNFEHEVSYSNGNDWIENVSLEQDSLLLIAVKQNDSQLERYASLKLFLNEGNNRIVSFDHNVFQSESDFEVEDFDELRSLISAPSGSTRIDAPLKVIEGYVISDLNNTNMETNTQTGFNTIDLDDSKKTAYVQSLDGKYGYRLKFSTISDNVLKRYSKIKILIDGLILEKEAEPSRFTLKDVKSGNILQTEDGVASNLVKKERYIGDLIDEDMYTYVTLKETSISVPYGSYANVNRGYVLKTTHNTQGTTAPYIDAIPTNIFDKRGDNLNVLVNVSSSWAFTSVSNQSGTISGILTHSKSPRYGAGQGEIGRYQIRPVNLADIKLTSQAVSHTIVEWNWMPNGTNGCATGALTKDSNGDILSYKGGGKLRTTVPNVSSGVGVNFICHSDPDSKAAFNNGVQFNNVKWWDADNSKGEGIILEFSTTGITANNVLVNFSIQGGSGNDASNHIPVYWEVETSTDGVNYSLVENSTFVVRPLVQWLQNRPFQSVGLIPYSIKLPTSILNKSKVFVKLKAKSDICATGSPTGGEGGRITSSMPGTSIRLGNILVNYN